MVNRKEQKVKKWVAKHSTENQRSNNAKPTKNWEQLRNSGRISNSCSTCGTCCVTLVTNLVICQE
jgi:fatty acid-binding protein DegV